MNAIRSHAKPIKSSRFAVCLFLIAVILAFHLSVAACSNDAEEELVASEAYSSDNLKTPTIYDSQEEELVASEAYSSDNLKTPTIYDSQAEPLSTVLPKDNNAKEVQVQEAELVGIVAVAKLSASPDEAATATTSVVAHQDEDAETQSEEEVVLEVDAEPEVSYAPETGSLGLDERILRADVIARATLNLISTTTPYIYRYGPPMATSTDYYVSAMKLRFSVHEYLKGSGGDTLSVGLMLSEDDYYSNVEEAVGAASVWISERDTRWDNREAILFLQNKPAGYEAATSQPDSVSHVFIIHTWVYQTARDIGTAYAVDEWYVDTYSISSEKSKAWLPATSEPASGASGASGTVETSYYLEEPPSAGTGASGQSSSVSSITLSDMKSRVRAMGNLLEQGEGVPGYRKCLVEKHALEREREYQGLTGPGPYFDADLHTSSGLPAESVFNDAWIFGGEGGPVYPRVYFTGPDMDLFSKEAEDNDNDSGAYRIVSKMRRPLPMGTYDVHNNVQHPIFFPCEFLPEPYSRWYIHVAAPAGTLHEAFFDPVLDTSTSAVGADSTNGVLKPSAFTVSGGATTTIGSLEWKSGTVKMNISPYTALGGHVLDFIELDGSVSLSLDAADATADTANNTLSWNVASQPWEDGDKLMLRIREAPNRPPVFDTSTYAFTVREDASAFHIIGFVSATDPDVGDSPWYYITGGNEAGRFQLGANNGEVLVWKALDYETASSYTLSVEARDGRENGTATATVEISVTDVAE